MFCFINTGVLSIVLRKLATGTGSLSPQSDPEWLVISNRSFAIITVKVAER
jgi:hypothetical protein